MALLTRACIIPVAAAGGVLPRVLTLILPRILARMLALIRRRWRAIVVTILPVIVPVISPVIVAAVCWLVPAMVGRRLPRNRGLHVGLAGSWHGHIRIAAPRVAVWIDLRSHKKGAVILLFWGARWHYRRNNIAGLRIAVLGGNAPVIKSIAL